MEIFLLEKVEEKEDGDEEVNEELEVSKSILQTIIELPKTIINLLLDALKSLFIPSEDFFTNWLDDLNSYFGEAFGILYYPFELLIDFLNRVGNIEDSGIPAIVVPSFTFSFLGYEATLIEGFTFDFNTILSNETFANIHNIYLIVVDVILWLLVGYLASKEIGNILGGISGTVSDEVYYSDEATDERAYESYARGQRAKDRYDNEQYEINKNRKKSKIGF